MSFGANTSLQQTWQADPQIMMQIVDLLSQVNSPDNAVQQHVVRVFNEIDDMPDATCYFATIVASPHHSTEVREVAGYALKAHLCSRHKDLSNEILSIIKPLILHIIQDPEKVVRQAVGAAITSLLQLQRAESWPEALQAFSQALDSTNDDIVDGAFSALCIFCEDELSSSDHETSEFFIHYCKQQFIPKLFRICTSGAKRFVKIYAVKCLSLFGNSHAFAPGSILEEFFPQYWNILGTLALETDSEMRKPIVQNMIQVVAYYPAAIIENGDAVISFIVNCCGDPDYYLRLEAVDFWPAILRRTQKSQPEIFEKCKEMIINKFHELLPILIKNTIFLDWDYLNMDPLHLQDDNAAVPDEAENMQPRFHNKERDQEKDNYKNQGAWGGGWTVRKGSAYALDTLSFAFSDLILPSVLPLVEANLVDPSWEVRESAVLSLGAIAQGCMQGLSPFLPKVLEFLLRMCDDSKPLLRSISCWCVSRFSLWICHPANNEEWLKPVLEQILKRVLDRNKRVQEAACSAFSLIEEEARDLLVPFLSEIISTLSQAFQMFQAKNVSLLCDVVGTLADSVNGALQKDTRAKELLAPIFDKWNSAPNDDPLLIPLFECLVCCAASLKMSFIPYAPYVIRRCNSFIQLSLTDIKDYEIRLTGEKSNRELLECSLDLLSSVTIALEENMPSLLAIPELNFLPYLESCCSDNAPGVLQSSFALVGDLTKYCVKELRPHIPSIITHLSTHLLHQSASVSNNAGWALGEFAMHAGKEYVEPHVDNIGPKLVEIIQRPELHRTLIQNVCITLGRLGLICPAKLAVILPSFLKPWCCIMRYARNDKDKAKAFEGLCAMIHECPDASILCLSDLLVTILAFHPCPPELEAQFTTLVQAIRLNYASKWYHMWINSPEIFQTQLSERFNLLHCDPNL